MSKASDSTNAGLDSADEVLNLLREQAKLYGKLEGLAARQRSVLPGEDTGPLLSVLSDRRKLSHALNDIAIQLEPVRRRWPAFRGCLAADRRTEAERLLQEASEALHRVIKSDEQDVRVLSGRKQAVADSLHMTHATSRTISAYRTPTQEPARVDCVCGDA